MKTTRFLPGLIAVMVLFCLNEVTGQWLFNGNHIYNTNSQNVGIGTGGLWTPTEKLHINNGTTPARILVEMSYGGSTGMQAISSLRLQNSATGDLYQAILRKNNTSHQMVQSCYDASAGAWREFNFFDFATRKYEMRAGILDAEFLNAGKLLLNNSGQIIINNTTVPSGYGGFKVFLQHDTAHGLCSYTTAPNSFSIYSYATATTGNNYAVYGITYGTGGAGGAFYANSSDGSSCGVFGRSSGDVNPNSCGVAGHHYFGGAGVGAWSWSGNLFVGYDGDFPGGTLRFYVNNSGAVYADGGYNTFKKVSKPGDKVEYRAFSAIESAERWIEDIGSGKTSNGRAVVAIDPVFAAAAGIKDDYKVFVTPVTDEIAYLIVTHKKADSFGVRAVTHDGRPVDCSFDYRIVVKDAEKANIRMEVVDIPEPADMPRKEAVQVDSRP